MRRRHRLHDNRVMQTLLVDNPGQRWGVRLSTLLLWALAAASLVYWGLRLSSAPAGLAVPAVASAPPAPDAQALARLLGALPAQAAAVPQVSSASPGRLVLVGVLAGQRSGGGAALIAVDGQPAKPFRVGKVIDGGLVLQSLGTREARLGASKDAPTTLTLELPPLR